MSLNLPQMTRGLAHAGSLNAGSAAGDQARAEAGLSAAFWQSARSTRHQVVISWSFLPTACRLIYTSFGVLPVRACDLQPDRWQLAITATSSGWVSTRRHFQLVAQANHPKFCHQTAQA